MRQIKKHYLEILRIELEDLREDLQLLIDECQRNRENGKITDYVFLENVTLFKNELLGVDEFFKIIDTIDTAQYETLE